MYNQLISLSPDLARLRNEGYDIELKGNCLVVHDVPYVNTEKKVQWGTLITPLTLAGDKTARPHDHVMYFVGDYPCNSDGVELDKIRNQSGDLSVGDGLKANHSFSSKPKVTDTTPNDFYEDFYQKITTYIKILSQWAKVIDPTVSAQTRRVRPILEEESVFKYPDTATTRAGIAAANKKLEIDKIAIIGLGGTGSYIFDLIAKTPVKEIHLWDGDTFYGHNAFRSPGAPSMDELNAQQLKTTYLADIYSKMRRGIIDHQDYISETNLDELKDMNFVFICIDSGSSKRQIIEKLEQLDIPFIDVGMGLEMQNEMLSGLLRVSLSTKENREAGKGISFSDDDGQNDYIHNIQVAELNSLNASLAVIQWKKYFGYYLDKDIKYTSVYKVQSNKILTEEINAEKD